MIEHPYVAFRRGFQMLFRVAHDNLLAGAGWVIITLGTQLPALLHPQLIIENRYAAPFMLLQVSFIIVFFMTLLFFFTDVRIRPERPASNKPTRLERVQTLLSIPMLPTITLVCVALPVIQAQTQLLMGIPLHFQGDKKAITNPDNLWIK